MFYKYLNSNKLNTSLCNHCFSRLLSISAVKARMFVPKAKPIYRQKFIGEYLYINDSKIAEIVVKHVSNDLVNDNSLIFESTPGKSLLTQHLLKSGAHLVRVFEDNPLFLDNLKKIQNKFPNRLQIINKQILNLPKLLYKHESCETEISDWFSGVPVRDWRSSPSLKFVAVLSPIYSTLFLRFIIRQLLVKELFFSFGRTQFLVFVSENEYKYMTTKSEFSKYINYRAVSVLYSTLFDIEPLETVSYKQFSLYPNTELTKKQMKKLEGNAILVRLTPKLYLDEFNGQTLKDYYYFVNQTFMKRKNYVIPFLENWFPNCGPELISNGIPNFKYFGDLSPEQVFDLFKYFHNESHYDISLYKTFMRSNFDNEDDEEIEIKETEDISDCEV